MAIQTIEILRNYMTCEDEAVKNKYYNLLDSFYHKSEGKILHSISENAEAITLQFTDGNSATANTSVVIPKLPNSKEISFISGLQDALNGKVEKVTGQRLTEQNFTFAEKQKLASLANYVKPNSEDIAYINGLQNALDDKVSVEEGKGLSTNDFTDALKTKLNGNNITSLSIQDNNGIPQFTITDVLNFKGAKFNAATKTIEVPNKLKEVIVQDKTQLLGTLESDKLYVIDGHFDFADGEYIKVPAGGLNISGYSFDASSISSFGVANHRLFRSPVGGSGNLIVHAIAFTTTGTNAGVFDLEDADGSHAIEMVTVNFSGCKTLGRLRNYRQLTGITIGIYGCDDGLMISGAWNGFKLSNTNCFGFGATGTVFKKDTDTLFSNRLYLEVNMDLPTGAKLIDFDPSNFQYNDLLQFNSTILKYNGVIDSDIADTVIPNITANDPKCLWRSNVGLPDTALEKFVDADVAGTYAIDWLNDTFNLTMTADTTFTDINLPATGKATKEIQIYLTGDFDPTFSAAWNANKVGTFKKGELNKLTVKFIKNGLYFLKIDNSLTIYPAPSLGTVVPAGLYPSQTQALTLNGSFFTPASIVTIEGQTVNTISFNNDTGALELSVTTGETEGDFNIFVSNGTGLTFQNRLTIALGDVFTPSATDWINVNNQLDISEGRNARIKTYTVEGIGTYNKDFDYTKNFSVRFRYDESVLGEPVNNSYERTAHLINSADDSWIMTFGILRSNNGGRFLSYSESSTTYAGSPITNVDLGTGTNMKSNVLEYRWFNGVAYLYIDSVLQATLSKVLTANCKLKIMTAYQDVIDIKYIELA